MRRLTKILVTAFQPFMGEAVNPSEILLEHINLQYDSEIETLLLPVSFLEAPRALQNHLKENNYDLILLLGQAGGRSKVCLERVALNWIESESLDEAGYKPKQGPIVEGADPALFTDLPLTVWKENLSKKNLPVEISVSAGSYVCNYLYYQTLRWRMNTQQSLNVCFVHVPYLPQQTLEKPNTPSLTLDEMKAVIFEILNWYR